MEMTSPRARTTIYAAVSLLLAAAVVAMAVVAARLADAAAGEAETARRAYLAKLAWVSVVTAAVAAVALIWVVVRFFAFRLSGPSRRTKTEHVDAWKLSGERFKMTAQDEENLETTWGEDQEKPEK